MLSSPIRPRGHACERPCGNKARKASEKSSPKKHVPSEFAPVSKLFSKLFPKLFSKLLQRVWKNWLWKKVWKRMVRSLQCWTGWAQRIPTGNCRESCWSWGNLPPTSAPQPSVSCEAGPHLVPGPGRSNAGLGGPRGFPLGTAANRVCHGEVLPLTGAQQRELRGGTPLGPGPGQVQCWIGWALRIPTKGTTALSK